MNLFIYFEAKFHEIVEFRSSDVSCNVNNFFFKKATRT